MECNNVRELLSLYIDNMLDDEQMREVEKHLATCDACKKEMEELAVFVLSMGLFKDTLSIFPEKLAGNEQTEMSYSEDNYGSVASKNAETEALADDSMAKTLTGSGLDDSMVAMPMEEVPVELKESPKSKSNNSYFETETSTENYSAESMYDTSNEESASADADADANAAYGFSAETPDSSNNNVRAFGSGTLSGSKKQCTRASLSSNVKRNTAAVQYYSDLITQKLEDYDYQILFSKYIESGEWHFKVLIFRGKDGTTFNEEIVIIGKDGEIKVIAKNEAMGL